MKTIKVTLLKNSTWLLSMNKSMNKNLIQEKIKEFKSKFNGELWLCSWDCEDGQECAGQGAQEALIDFLVNSLTEVAEEAKLDEAKSWIKHEKELMDAFEEAKKESYVGKLKREWYMKGFNEGKKEERERIREAINILYCEHCGKLILQKQIDSLNSELK